MALSRTALLLRTCPKHDLPNPAILLSTLPQHSTLPKPSHHNTEYNEKPTTHVLAKTAGTTMRNIRTLQKSVHVAAVTTCCGQIFSSGVWLYYEQGLVLSSLSTPPFVCSLILCSLLVPMALSTRVLGLLELRVHTTKQVALSHLDLFGRRRDEVWHITQCVISEEIKAISTPGGRYWVRSWRDAPEKTLRYLTEQTEDNEVTSRAPGIVAEPYFIFLFLSVLTTWALTLIAYGKQTGRLRTVPDPTIKDLDESIKGLKDRLYEIKNRYW